MIYFWQRDWHSVSYTGLIGKNRVPEDAQEGSNYYDPINPPARDNTTLRVVNYWSSLLLGYASLALKENMKKKPGGDTCLQGILS